MSRIEELTSLVENFSVEYDKFTEKGNKTAGTRARKYLQEIRNLSKDVREEISETKRQMVGV